MGIKQTLGLFNGDCSIIYVSISGYGQSGPYKNIRVYDPLVQATAGSASAQNTENPELFRTIVFDKVTGLTAAQAISTALLHKEKKKETTSIANA